ncbi:hypothetical protein H0H92_005899 [Tricholoma furcatifolium]|nr:hypothetical protein H0H92_005899 [Tricholoma furcatifolium]
MLPSNPSTGHIEAIALSCLPPALALSTDCSSSHADEHELGITLAAPQLSYSSGDRIRRLSSHTPSKLDSQTHLAPSMAHTSSLHARAVPPAAPSISPEDQDRQRKIALLHFITICCAIFGSGWNDGSSGPLLPAFQRQYNSVVLGVCLQLTAYVMQAPGPPFPVMVLGNFVTGLGLSLLNAQANGFVSSFSQNMETKLGIMHACYGFGAFSSPFVATYFSAQRHWSFHYFSSAGLAIFNIIALTVVFRFKRSADLLEQNGQARQDTTTVNQAPIRNNVYRQVFSLPTVHVLTAFALIYIGVEVTLGGWIVTFIIRERGGGHSSGYISSGFFGGLTLGRIGLLWLNKRVRSLNAT